MQDEPDAKRQRTEQPPDILPEVFEHPKVAYRALELKKLMQSSRGFLGSVANQWFFTKPDDDGNSDEDLSTKAKRALALIRIFVEENESSKDWTCGWVRTGNLLRGFVATKGSKTLSGVRSARDFKRFAEELYKDFATDSMYGDMQKVDTVLDPAVRRSRELVFQSEEKAKDEVGTWTFDCAFLADLELAWREHMDLFPVVVKPHKLVMYAEGDFFLEHRDTPEPQLVGSIVVGLLDTSENGGLVLDRNEDSTHSSEFGRYWFFRPDVLHEVRPIVGGARCVMTFKVFAKLDEAGHEHEQQPGTKCPLEQHDKCIAIAGALTELLDEQCEREHDRVGLLLWHEYSRKSVALEGKDYLLMCAAKHVPGITLVRNIPVRVDFSMFQVDEEKPEIETCDVFSLEDTVLQQIEAESDVIEGLLQCPFFQMAETRPESAFKKTSTRGGFTGNEAEPSTENCIYIHRALILERKRTQMLDSEN